MDDYEKWRQEKIQQEAYDKHRAEQEQKRMEEESRRQYEQQIELARQQNADRQRIYQQERDSLPPGDNYPEVQRYNNIEQPPMMP